jgi:hypothetical protein
MAYSTPSNNDQILCGSQETTNQSQFDAIWFTDFMQYAAPTTSTPAEGGFYFAIAANGGANTNLTTSVFDGITAANGAIQMATGTTNNATGYAVAYSHQNIIPGIPTPTNGFVTKYEFECLIRSPAIHSNTVRGAFRLGFMNVIANAAPTKGVYFEFLCDGTTTDTTWKVVFMNTTSEKIDTAVTVSSNATYRMYLSVEVNSAGTYTTTYKIKNMTADTNTEGTASPSTTARYPTAATDYIGIVIINTKAVTATTTSRNLYVDYLGARIRRPLSREILIGNI